MNEIINKSANNTECVLCSSVDWILWKDLLSESFRILTNLHISKYQIFNFNKDSPGSVNVMKYTTSTERVTFPILKENTTPYHTSINTRRCIRSQKFKAKWKKTGRSKFVKESNRKNYLEKFICNRYFKDNAQLRGMFFEFGGL